jgi:hypothetical protein
MIPNLIVGTASVEPGFSPADIANLQAWYDAADTATISVSGTAVTQWNDKSANGYNVTQGTGARRPTSGVNTQNGKNVISFDGNDLLQAATASNWTFINNATGATIFFAIYFNASAVENTVLATAFSSAHTGFFSSKSGSDILVGLVYRGVASTETSVLVSGSLPDNSAKYVSMVLDNANATAANRLIFKINGGSNITGNTSTASLSTSAPFQPLIIGAYDSAGSGGLNGNVCEVIIYSGQLAAGDITAVNSYLASKWAI